MFECCLNIFGFLVYLLFWISKVFFIVMLWDLQSGASRVVSCIEANEMGFDFLNTCSRCDYYMQNHALNAKALKLPSLVLSSMWQCTGNHILGDLCHHQSQKTPYRATKINSYNSYITSKSSVRASNNNSGSEKRPRLAFDHNTPQLEEQNTPLSTSSLSLSCQLRKHLYLYVLHHCLHHPYLS